MNDKNARDEEEREDKIGTMRVLVCDTESFPCNSLLPVSKSDDGIMEFLSTDANLIIVFYALSAIMIADARHDADEVNRPAADICTSPLR